MIVDIHAHYFPQEYTDLLMRIGGRTLPEAARPLTARPMRQDAPAGIQTRLQQMDEAEVQLQVLSPAASPPYADKEADAVAAARLINDSYAALAQQYPGDWRPSCRCRCPTSTPLCARWSAGWTSSACSACR